MEEDYVCGGQFASENSKEKLTITQLKNIINYKNISDEVAQEIIESLYQLSIIAYHNKI